MGEAGRPSSIARLLLPSTAAIALLFGGPANAEDEHQACPDKVLATVADWAGIKGRLRSEGQADGIVAGSACQAMSDAPGTLVVAVAFDAQPGKSPEDEDHQWEQVIALVDQRSNDVVAASHSTIEEDAITHVGSESYRIDADPIRLSPTARAVGVVFDSDARGASCADAYASSELTLWLREGAHLRAVMGTNLQGGVGLDGAFCKEDVQSEDADMVVGVEKSVTHGFFDLSITAYRSGTHQRLARTVLKYDGNSYGFDMFRKFWYPDSVKKRWGIQ
jgi:hypothetical protein